MNKLINDRIEILKESNKFNLESITNEEIGEFREARIDYEKALEESKDKKHIQRKFESMLDEIADVYVVTNQWEFPILIRSELLTLEEKIYLNKVSRKNKKYIESVMLMKMERTFLRNRIDWYK